MVKSWVFIINILLLGCVNNNFSKEPALLNRDVFTSILIDCEKYQISQIDTIKSNSLLSDSLILENILTNYNCSSEQYYKTLSFYMDHPDTMLVLFNEVKRSVIK
tara:strand:- start:90 stop:404 length:315 start_codon:yes stop_codon:yes gene_type:complete